MKRFFLLGSFALCYLWLMADQYDQQYFSNASTIQLEKAGALAKELGKDVESITALQIKGEMSDKDMKALAKCTNLRKLSLRYANIEKTKYFPVFQNLDVLFLPDRQYIPVEYFELIPANKSLKVLMLCSFKYYMQQTRDYSGYQEIRFSPFASLSKVIISSYLEKQSISDNKGYGNVTKEPILVDTLIDLSAKVSKNELFKARLYEGVNNYLFYIGDKDVDFSKIDAIRAAERRYSGDNFVRIRPVIPSNLDLQKMRYIGSDYFNDTEVEEITFSSSSIKFGDGIYNGYKGAFNGAKKLKKITFASTLKNLTIPAYTFAECPSLETIVFDCPVTIEENAFGEYSNLKEVIFNKPAVIKSRSFYGLPIYMEIPSIEKVTFNASVSIESKGFENIEEVIFNAQADIKSKGIHKAESIVFNAIPVSLTKDFASCKSIKIPSAEGAYDKFLSLGISPDYLIDPSANLTLDIVVIEAGNILKYLPLDKLTQIKSLTITGHLYETDIAILKQCTNLQYLDLENTYISESPTSQERRQAENKMWADIAELAAVDAAVKVETGQSTKREAKQQVADAMRSAAIMQKKDMPDCFIPAGAFANMRLIEVILPKTVKQVNNAAFNGCKSLTKIDLGENLEIIGRYAFAETQLKEISFPVTLKEIKGEAFDKVKSLKVIDLSKCTMEHFANNIGGAEVNASIGCLPDLEIFYMPQGMTTFNPFVKTDCSGLKEVYVGKDVNVMNYSLDNVKIHFQTEMAPELNSFGFSGKITNCIIYVPKNGNITSYYAKFNGNGNKIIQE